MALERIKKIADIRILLFFVAFLFCIFFMVATKNTVCDDALQYDIIAWNLASGHGYSLNAQQPFEPTNLREPGYVLFLSAIYKLFGHKIGFVYFAQSFLFSLSVVLLFVVVSDIFNERIAKYAAFFTAACPTLANFTAYLYCESFFMFLLIFSMFSLLKAKSTHLLMWYLISGIAVSFMVLCKGIMLFFIIPVFFYLYKNNVKKAILLLIIFLIPIFIWSFRNYTVFKSFNMANRADIIFAIRAYKADNSPQRIKETAVYTISEFLGSKIFPQTQIKPRDVLFLDDYKTYDRYNELVREGKAQAEVESIIRSEAFAKIKKHPLRYLLYVQIDLIKMMSFMYIPALNERAAVDFFKNINGGLLALSVFKGLYKLSSFVIVIISLFGIFFRKINWNKEAMLIAVFIYINFMYSIIGGYPRYAVPLIPIYFIFATLGIARFLNWKIQ